MVFVYRNGCTNMPSFAYEVKDELARVKNANKCCNFTELTAMLKIGAEIYDSRIDFINTNAAVARKVLKLIKAIYNDIHTEVAVIRNKKFRTFNRYVVRIFLTSETKSLFNTLNNNSLPRESCCQCAYFRGMFMAGGSINKPESKYHLEIVVHSKSNAKAVLKNLQKMGFPFRLFERQDNFVVYIKEGDTICDLLYMVKADRAAERFEVAQNLKEVRAQVNRIVNCETANLQKSIDAAHRQIKDINLIMEQKIELIDELKLTAEARLKYPDASIPELATKLFMSTSGLKHRFARIHKIASNLKTICKP